MRARILERRALARAVVSLIGRPIGFFWCMSETRPFLSNQASFFFDRYAASAHTVELAFGRLTRLQSCTVIDGGTRKRPAANQAMPLIHPGGSRT